MRWLRVLLLRIRALVSGRRLDAETREEIQQHLERQVEANVAAGMSPDAARRAAALDVGSVGQLTEAARDARGLLWWDTVRSDIRHAVRQIRRRPGFASAVMLTMAIGVGATSAVFAVVDSVVLRPLPYPHAERLYSLYEINSRSNIGRTRATPLNFFDWREQAKSFDGMAAQIGTGFTFTGLTGTSEKPPSAWTPEQVVDFMLESLGRGDFYILCPDNAVDRATDERRMQWSIDDIIKNRPALSRWHPDFEAAFEAYMQGHET